MQPLWGLTLIMQGQCLAHHRNEWQLLPLHHQMWQSPCSRALTPHLWSECSWKIQGVAENERSWEAPVWSPISRGGNKQPDDLVFNHGPDPVPLRTLLKDKLYWEAQPGGIDRQACVLTRCLLSNNKCQCQHIACQVFSVLPANSLLWPWLSLASVELNYLFRWRHPGHGTFGVELHALVRVKGYKGNQSNQRMLIPSVFACKALSPKTSSE